MEVLYFSLNLNFHQRRFSSTQTVLRVLCFWYVEAEIFWSMILGQTPKIRSYINEVSLNCFGFYFIGNQVTEAVIRFKKE